ncbi:unnamed protein product [Cylicocyclus nassatus]|uniref:Beta-lactamase-related domain-containing protein n=1 Tax=Cylicocyclus nassatus TaxID=53992 RepID=A0AA36H387_CYLNA|nr:unnamed protein product [Cylicocyclus nassatus]
MVWYKSIRPVVLAASALAYGANKAALLDDGSKNERRPYGAALTMEEKRKKAKQAIKRQMVIAGIPGLSVGVSVDGRVVWRDGFGFANVESRSRCTENTVMRIASISKPITATIAARLAQSGKLDLDKPIQEYLPNYPQKKFDGKPVTISVRQLLSHTGGIRHYKKEEKDKLDPDAFVSSDSEAKEFYSNVCCKNMEESLAMFQNDDLIAKPGMKFSYSTYGTVLVSAVLEKASGKEYKKLLEDLTFQLGLRHTTLDENKRVIPDRTNYYVRNRKHILENCPEVDNSCKWAGGGLLSDVNDLLTFANYILYSHQADPNAKDAYLSKEVIDMLWNGQAAVNDRILAGLGWMRVNSDDFAGGHQKSSLGGIWYHTGAGVGASSVLLIRPKNSADNKPPSGVCVAMLCNLQDTSLLNLAKEIEEIFRD